jgi:hypothetical protein
MTTLSSITQNGGVNNKSREASIRKLARKHGYQLHKSREWKNVPHGNNFGNYMLVELDQNAVVLGARFDATLDDIERFLRETADGEQERSTLPSKRKPPEVEIRGIPGKGIFVLLDGRTVAERDRGKWISLEPGVSIHSAPDHCTMTIEVDSPTERLVVNVDLRHGEWLPLSPEIGNE